MPPHLQYTHYQNEQAPSLLILHGLLGSKDNWRHMATLLSAYFNVYCIDCRNHGHSFHAPSMTYTDMAEDTFRLLLHLGLSNTFILGHSMGGKTVMTMLGMQEKKERPLPRIQKAIILDIAPVHYPPHYTAIFTAIKQCSLSQYRTRSDILAAFMPTIGDVASCHLLLKNISRHPAGRFQWRCNIEAIKRAYPGIMSVPPLHVSLSTPTLFIRGGQSDYITAHARAYINTLFLHASHRCIEKAGHWVHADCPADVLQHCRDYLK